MLEELAARSGLGAALGKAPSRILLLAAGVCAFESGSSCDHKPSPWASAHLLEVSFLQGLDGNIALATV